MNERSNYVVSGELRGGAAAGEWVLGEYRTLGEAVSAAERFAGEAPANATSVVVSGPNFRAERPLNN